MVNRKPAPPGPQTVQLGLEAAMALPEPERPAIVTVRIADIRNLPKPEDLRYSPEKWDSLLQTMRTVGQQKFIEVSPTADGGWTIEDGRHRVAAAIALGWTEVQGIVRHDRSKLSSAVARVVVNNLCEANTPYQDAVAYQEALDEGVAVPDLAKMVGESPATVSQRIGLLCLGPELAMRVGHDMTLEAADLLVDLHKHSELFQRAVATLPAPKDVAKRPRPYLDAHEVRQLAVRSLTQGDGAPAITLDDDSLGTYYERSDPEVQKRAAKLPHVKLGNQVLYLDVPKLRGIVEAVRDLRAKRAKAVGRKPGESKEQQEARLRARLMRQVRSTQLDLMVRHVKSRPSWGDDLTKAIMRLALERCRSVAVSKAEQQAQREITGIADLDVQAGAGVVDQLWEKDRAALDRYLAGVVFLAGKDWGAKVVRDEAVALLATGMTFEQACEAAQMALDDRKAKPKKAGSKGAAAEPAAVAVAESPTAAEAA